MILIGCAAACPAARAQETPPLIERLEKAANTYQLLAEQYDGVLLPVPARPVKPGRSYAGLPRLAVFLKLVGDLPAKAAAPRGPGVYKGSLVRAVKHFQRRHGLPADGILGKATFAQLNIPLSRRVTQLRLALERWKALPTRFEQPPIIINIPEFILRAGSARDQGSVSLRVVVGKSYERQTPVFASEITSVVFRPPWTVPLSIQKEELVPKLTANPSYLVKNNFEIIDTKGNLISTAVVNQDLLARLGTGELILRQKPGPTNSLGLVKFGMPNEHGVFLHGSPSKWDFERSRRDLSHSCIRVQNPLALAAWALKDRPEWTPAKMQEAIAGTETIEVKLEHPIPVLIHYGTAEVGEDGVIRFFEDIYELDNAEAAANAAVAAIGK